ncbi:MAG: hypothetical protein OJF47_003739 [Nitrospira sp.]|jgi:hypothetical protein|nr:MAG: hypothetical protein OJF47_003739 [Nitrospira sp.]
MIWWLGIAMAVSMIGCSQPNGEGSLPPGSERNLKSVMFSTVMGGQGGFTEVRDIAVDRQGFIYVTGGTESADFPTTPGVYDRSFNGSSDAFVMKLTVDGKIVWATYLGGPSHDRAYAIEVDEQGYVYISGRAGDKFPVTDAVFQPRFLGGPPQGPYPSQSGFVAKVSPEGNKLLWASYFGAGDDPSHPVRDLALDPDGSIFIAASSTTGAYPKRIRQAFDRGNRSQHSGKRDAVLARLKNDGTEVMWATYLGGRESEGGEGSVRITSKGNVYLLTTTESDDAPVTPGAYGRTYHGGGDFYLAKFSAEGALLFASYLGGSDLENLETHELAVDGDENAIIASGSLSRDYPTTSGGVQPSYAGSGGSGTGGGTNYPGDVVVTKISADGTRLLASTFLGGRYGESVEGVEVDSDGNVSITGGTFSDDFPVTGGALQARLSGNADAFVVTLSADLTHILYATYVGGKGGEACRALAVSPTGAVIIGGATKSSGWPIVQGFQEVVGARGAGVLLGLRPQ